VSPSAGTRQPEEADAALVQKARSGDLESFGELVRRHERTVQGIVTRMIPSPDDAEDVVQEVFVSAWQGLQRFRGDARFSTWLHTIAVNATLKRIRQMRRHGQVSLDDPESGTAERLAADAAGQPFEQAVSAEEKAAVRRALQNLSDNHRMTVVLYYFEEHPCEEIARMMGCSVGTVWSRLHYACKKLKQELRDIRGSDGAPGARGERPDA
jgi:RNA polymerase sigma-70 factor (ECF subfamily)